MKKLPAVTSGLLFFFFFWIKWFHLLSDQSCQQTVRKEKEAPKKHHAWNEAESLHLPVCTYSWKSGAQRRQRAKAQTSSLSSFGINGRQNGTDGRRFFRKLVSDEQSGKVLKTSFNCVDEHSPRTRLTGADRGTFCFRACRLRSYPLELRAFLCRPLTDRKYLIYALLWIKLLTQEETHTKGHPSSTNDFPTDSPSNIWSFQQS